MTVAVGYNHSHPIFLNVGKQQEEEVDEETKSVKKRKMTMLK
jgi:hypothetical protein